MLDRTRTLSCQGGPNCQQDGAWKEDAAPTTEVVFVQEDADKNRWVAYVTAKWQARIDCEGNSPDINWALPAAAQELRYNEGAPDCGKTRVYSGCVIAYAGGDTEIKAIRAAAEQASGRAEILFDEDFARDCPDQNPKRCRQEQTKTSSQKLERLFERRIRQADGDKFIAYARAWWTVTIECPMKLALREGQRTDRQPV